MALSKERNTPRRGDTPSPSIHSLPMKASTKVYQGGLVVIDAGYAAPGSTATGKIAAGVAMSTTDNSTGSAGAQSVEVRSGVFRFDNSTSTDAIAQSEVGKSCFIVDDAKVAKTDGTGARSVAGIVHAVDSAGVWVEINPALSQVLATAIAGLTLPT